MGSASIGGGAIFRNSAGESGTTADRPPVAEPAPAGLRLSPDSGTRLVANGSVLVGGSPVRVLRLTPAGSRQVAGWFAGTPLPAGAAARNLARRLLDAGLAHPDFREKATVRFGGTGPAVSGPPIPRPGPGDVTVVIP